MEEIKCYCYILKFRDNTFYTGITTDLERRIGEHKANKVISTAGKIQFEIVHKQLFADRITARKAEVWIKDFGARKFLAKKKFENFSLQF